MSAIEEHREITDKKIHKLSTDLQLQQQELTELKRFCHQNNMRAPDTATTMQPQVTTSKLPDRNSPDRGIRRNNLIISGIDVGSEDPKIFISAFLTAHFSIREDSLLAVQRINTRGRHSENETAAAAPPGRYLLTFKSFWDSNQIYNQRLQKLRNQNIFISEDLSPSESSLFFKARQLRKANIILSTWTKDGKTFVRKDIGDEPIELSSEHPLLLQFAKLNAPKSDYQQSPKTLQITERAQQHIATTSTTPSLQDTSIPQTSPDDIDSDDEELKQLLEGALSGAITRAANKKKHKKNKEHKDGGPQ